MPHHPHDPHNPHNPIKPTRSIRTIEVQHQEPVSIKEEGQGSHGLLPPASFLEMGIMLKLPISPHSSTNYLPAEVPHVGEEDLPTET